ncbi:cell division protein ZapA [Caenispirillum bisanense]|uniref:cell division protein ZapA n=1 Tax=Caenispirillum bisanense TaxID=414052 RepID=UPI0031DF8FC4
MGQVTITINERAYTVACDDGQEAHIEQLGNYLDARARDLVRNVGMVSDNLLLVMTALTVADELTDAHGELEVLRGDGEAREQAEAEVVDALDSVAQRISTVADRLEQS